VEGGFEEVGRQHVLGGMRQPGCTSPWPVLSLLTVNIQCLRAFQACLYVEGFIGSCCMDMNLSIIHLFLALLGPKNTVKLVLL
jgi:hypothetical protein